MIDTMEEFIETCLDHDVTLRLCLDVKDVEIYAEERSTPLG
jgi:hypothetical protein